MHKITYLRAAVAAMAMAFCMTLHAETEVNDTLPHIKIINKIANVDTIGGHRPVTGEIRFTNDGGAPLYILRVRGDCGCTSADYPFDAIAPGDTATISITFDPRNRRHGPFRKMVRIKSNAGNHTTVAYIEGVIRKSFVK